MQLFLRLLLLLIFQMVLRIDAGLSGINHRAMRSLFRGTQREIREQSNYYPHLLENSVLCNMLSMKLDPRAQKTRAENDRREQTWSKTKSETNAQATFVCLTVDTAQSRPPTKHRQALNAV
jgi:hypothetical protein